MFYWVNREGSLCLGIGALFGFAGAGLGYLIGQQVGVYGGFVLGCFTGGLAIIVADALFRVRAVYQGQCGPVAAFFWPGYGGTVNFFHASFEGVFFLALGGFLTYVCFNIETDKARKDAARKEADHLQRITQELPRQGIGVEFTDSKSEWTAKLTNNQGKDFARVVVRVGLSFPGVPLEHRTVEWATWKAGETKTITDKRGAGRLEFVGFDVEAYPAGAAEPRFHMWIPGQVKKGVWTGVEPPKS
jgi:hypothetical protein